MKQPTASSYLSNTKSNYKSYDKIAQHGSPTKSASRRLQSQTQYAGGKATDDGNKNSNNVKASKKQQQWVNPKALKMKEAAATKDKVALNVKLREEAREHSFRAVHIKKAK